MSRSNGKRAGRKPASSKGHIEKSGRGADVAILAVTLLLTAITFGNAIDGEFVYDDAVQIVNNPLIIESGRVGEALTSDVWAFTGDGDAARSNYWRPTFVLWLIGNFRLFGLDDPTPWHVTNILLHFGVLCMAFGVLRQLDVSRPLTAAVLFLFATHPVHVESVTWISGSPDLLLSFAVLGTLWLVLSRQNRPAAFKLPLAVLAHVFAVGSKELGIMVPALVFVAVLSIRYRPGRTLKPDLVRAAVAALPFVLVSATYFVVRLALLGRFELERAWHHSPLELLLTAPSLLAFYVRQMIFPYELGPNYALRVVGPGNLSLMTFGLPVLVSGLFAWLMWRGLRCGVVAWIGTTIFVLFLLPAMNINAFLPEQLVHDRYLYLPLLGFLMVAIPGVAVIIERYRPRITPAPARVVLIAATIVSLALAIQSRHYNRAWMTDLALWTRGVQVDPSSAFNQSQYGIYLLEDGRLEEARTALDLAIEAEAVTGAYLARGSLNAREGRLEDAARDLLLVIETFPDDPRPYSRLALVYQQAGRLDKAAAILRQGREQVPRVACDLTSNLGVVLYLSGDKAATLAELEQVPALAPSRHDAGCRHGVFHLGQLYIELGRLAEAREMLIRFVELTGTFQDEKTLAYRDQARRQIEQIGAGVTPR